MCKCDKCGHEPLTPRMRAIRELMRATRNERIGRTICVALSSYGKQSASRGVYDVTDADLADALEKLNA